MIKLQLDNVSKEEHDDAKCDPVVYGNARILPKNVHTYIRTIMTYLDKELFPKIQLQY